MIAAVVSNAGDRRFDVTLLRPRFLLLALVEPSKHAPLTVHASCSTIHAVANDDCHNP